MEFELIGEFIKLEQILKATNVVCTGGEAKIVIAEGMVSVNGETELRRGKKLYRGDVVTFGESEILVV